MKKSSWEGEKILKKSAWAEEIRYNTSESEKFSIYTRRCISAVRYIGVGICVAGMVSLAFTPPGALAMVLVGSTASLSMAFKPVAYAVGGLIGSTVVAPTMIAAGAIKDYFKHRNSLKRSQKLGKAAKAAREERSREESQGGEQTVIVHNLVEQPEIEKSRTSVQAKKHKREKSTTFVRNTFNNIKDRLANNKVVQNVSKGLRRNNHGKGRSIVN